MKTSHASAVVCLTVLATACGDSHHGRVTAPWADEPVNVIDDKGAVTAVGPFGPEYCVEYSGEFCLEADDVCDTEATDILIGEKGDVLGTLCYPAAGTVTVEEITAQSGEIAQNENNAVLVLDDLPDGSDLVGDIHVDANNVVVYGSGPDTSVIEGDVDLDGNSGIVRGVRITGDLVLTKNNNVVAFSVVEGDVIVRGNNMRLLDVTVLGDLTVEGKNAKLAGVDVAGSFSADGSVECSESYAFSDDDASGTSEDVELGAPLDC